LAGWLVGWLLGWLFAWLVGWLFGWLVGWLVDWLAGWLVCWLVGGWLVGWLAGWFVGWLVVGWLVGCLLEPTGEVRKTTLTPLHIVLLDKLIVAELFNYFPTFSATRMFFIVFKTPGHWFIYQSASSRLIYLRSISILSSNPCLNLPNCLCPSKRFVHVCRLLYLPRAPSCCGQIKSTNYVLSAFFCDFLFGPNISLGICSLITGI
jgi:hypothetical protein